MVGKGEGRVERRRRGEGVHGWTWAAVRREGIGRLPSLVAAGEGGGMMMHIFLEGILAIDELLGL